MPSSASLVRTYALELVGRPYKLGEEFWYVVGDEQTRITDGDCSGLVYAVFRRAGVKVGGKPLPRETAHDYYRRATRIEQPAKVGDLGFLLKSGHAYHVFMYVGNGQVVEAGDGTGKVGLRTVAHENARGTLWGRLATDIKEDDMTPDEVRAIVREETDVIWSPDVDAAQKALVKLGLLSAPRPHGHAASSGYVALLVYRALKLVAKWMGRTDV